MVTCRSCASDRLSTFLSLGDMPPSDGFLTRDQLAQPETRFPLDVAFCHQCTMVQILETVPPKMLFGRGYFYFSSVSDTVLSNARANVDEVMRSRRLTADSLVVELASNDGYLLRAYQEHGVPVLGIDPAPAPVAEARRRGTRTLQAFFDIRLARRLTRLGLKADVMHANNVLAHVANTNGFVAGIAELLKDDGVAIIEAPYVRNLIEHCEFDTIYHEHLCYFSVTSLVNLFRQHGLTLNDVQPLPIHGGSLRLFVGHRPDVSDRVNAYLEEERRLGITEYAWYADFADRVAVIRDDLRRLMDDLKRDGRRVAAYGAAAKGTILLNAAGLTQDHIQFVADLNTHKTGLFVPGARIEIAPPQRILDDMPDYLLLLAWNHRDEILAQQQEYRRRGGRFIIPIPSLEIV